MYLSIAGRTMDTDEALEYADKLEERIEAANPGALKV